MSLEASYQKKLNRATIEQLDEIYQHFYNCRDWFPHIRKDYVQRQILKGNVIYDRTIIIIFNQYKRRQRLGRAEAQKGDVILHQILSPFRNKLDFDKFTVKYVLDDFVKEMDTNVWLSVRADNDVAINFYKRNGFQIESDISWMKGQLKGLVFLHRK